MDKGEVYTARTANLDEGGKENQKPAFLDFSQSSGLKQADPFQRRQPSDI